MTDSRQHGRHAFQGLAQVLLLAAALALGGCSLAPPQGIEPIEDFQVSRYLGKWYEVARMDHSFERGLTDVSATYRLRDDQGIEVINRGFDPDSGNWREAIGKAYFTGPKHRASLKVSFFGPFYGGYHVVDLDRTGYRWAMVVGPDRDYVWILSRSPRLEPQVRQRLLDQGTRLGIATDKLIWVEHSRPDGGAQASGK